MLIDGLLTIYPFVMLLKSDGIKEKKRNENVAGQNR